jgi:RHS repeat-associated protein
MTVSPRPGVTETTAYSYNADGQLTCEVSPVADAAHVSCPASGSGHTPGTTSYTYDGDGRVTSVTGPAGQTTSYGYDLNGNLSQVIEPDRPHEIITDYTFNALGEQTSETINGTLVASAAYDQRGDEDAQTDVGGSATHYYYNLLGQVTAMVAPRRQTTRFRYDRAGNQTGIVSPSGQVTAKAYNAADELTAVTYGDGNPPAVRYTYYPDGQQRTVADASGSTGYTYDGDQRLTQASAMSPGGDDTYGYKYRDNNRQVILTYPNGRQVVSSYDEAGQLTSVRDWLGNTIAFRYDLNGNLASERFPGGVRVSYGIQAITVASAGNAPARFSETTDPAGRVESTASSGVPGAAATQASYTYNQLGQLQSAGSASYGYDAAGSLNALPGGTTQRFTPAGELSTSSTGLGYHYDKDGNLVAITSRHTRQVALDYNQADQLTGYRTKGTTTSYAYNGDGLISSSSDNGVATGYVWDQAPATPLLLAASATSYIYGPNGQPVEQITGGKAAFLVADQQGNTRLLTNSSGSITGSYSYSPYGLVTGHAGAGATALQYDGQLTTGTGFIYMRARYYQPTTGQFLTRDPVVSLTGSPYGYADENPVNASDPTGLFWNPFSLISDAMSAIVRAAEAIGSSIADAISAVGAASQSVIGVGVQGAELLAEAATSAADFIADHWRGIVKGALIAGEIGLGVACAVITSGICSLPAVLAISSGVSVADYLVEPGPKSWSGVLSAATLGLIKKGSEKAGREVGSRIAGKLSPAPANSAPVPMPAEPPVLPVE